MMLLAACLCSCVYVFRRLDEPLEEYIPWKIDCFLRLVVFGRFSNHALVMESQAEVRE